ncbi:hypothetical protein PVK06_024801 [Gossypium arboreum]|uniref:DUF4283 domain-containing protein n=1 Tax=Gossypium arboreum TaxID=29729 RepID=A0ABR0PEX4_GOSAR|nr:hypothetical protein PVK06_024801 [Gossypium arboreum]
MLHSYMQQMPYSLCLNHTLSNQSNYIMVFKRIIKRFGLKFVIEEELANLNLLDDEEEAFQEEIAVVDRNYQFCLVGRCLTDSLVHFPSLRNTMADLWHPIEGICITDLGDKRYLFQFFNNVDVQRVVTALGIQKYMRIRVRLDVTVLLKRKKKIQIGKIMIVYARFKYEKLSLFCFICGKLGRGESYCLFRLKIEPSKIVFGWDLSLHAVPRCQNIVVSRWLREADTSQCRDDNMEIFSQCSNFNKAKDFGRNLGGDFRNQVLNPYLIPLGSNQQYFINGQSNWRNWGKDDSNIAELVNGPMDLVLVEENDPITALEGKKGHRTVEGGNDVGGPFKLTASSGEQSSRAL